MKKIRLGKWKEKIQTKIAVIIVLAIFITAVINGVLGSVITRFSTNTAIEQTLYETVKVTALAASNMISTYTGVIAEIATNDVFTDPKSTHEEKTALIQNKVSAYYMHGGGFTDEKGYDPVSKRDVSNQPFYQNAIQGRTYMSSPYAGEEGENLYMVVSAPVYQGETITGIVYFVCDNSLLQSIVESVEVGEAGTAYMLDKEGNTIASSNVDAVYTQENLIHEAEAAPDNKRLQEMAAIEKDMIAGNTAVDKYRNMNGDVYLQGYTPISTSDGWSIAVEVSEGEFMRPAVIGNYIQLGMMAAFLLLGLLAAVAAGRSIAEPIGKCSDRLNLLSKGDFHSPMPDITNKDEVKVLSDSMQILTSNLQQVLSEVGSMLEKIAGGDLTMEEEFPAYPGDFAVLKDYFEMIHRKLNDTMQGIINVSRQVSGGAEQVAQAGSILATGSNDQSNAIDLLASDIGELTVKISNAARGAEKASEMSSNAGKQLMNGVDAMNNLIEAVNEIAEKSEEISNIIMTIEDISSQTNILALNASIEAARAGESGKGFAIIAENVRELATKTAEATQTISDLIHDAVSVTHRGTELARVTSGELKEVMKLAEESNQHISKISSDVIEQSEAVKLINERVEEISSVVESNTATSEETAATSEELSRQADIMKSLVSKFHLNH